MPGAGIEEMEGRVHRGGTGAIDMGGEAGRAPCIMLGRERLDRIVAAAAGRPVAAETGLDVMRDGLGHVYVEVSFKFPGCGGAEKVLLNAADSLEFFELMASSMTIAFLPSGGSAEKMFAIQLPKRERVELALGMIREGLAAGGGGGKGRPPA